jgi:hypothetical protein
MQGHACLVTSRENPQVLGDVAVIAAANSC